MKIRKLVPLIAAGTAFLAATGLPAQASSHREAPFITEQPKVDGTDWYAFRSYETGREGFVTFVANYQPLQAPYGGPSYFQMDPEALYEMHISNDGDADEEITFQFRFQNTLRDLPVLVNGAPVSVPLINIGSIGPGVTDNLNLNVVETYDLTVVRGDKRTGFTTRGNVTNAADASAATNSRFAKPVDNIGNKSIPDYETYANNHIFNVSIPGCTTDVNTQGRVFVGQRKDPFVINLGEIFDLVNVTDPVGGRDVEEDVLRDANVTSMVLEVPISCLTNPQIVAPATAVEPVIGSWTSSSLRQGRLLNPTQTFNTPAAEGGAWTQVSRLGTPLVNEVVIGLKDKNLFNSSEPKGDAQFATYVMTPTLPEILEMLNLGVSAPNVFPRADLVQAFLTGVPTVNQPAGVVPSEMLRLNTSLPPTPQNAQNNLGAAACFVNSVLTLTNPGCDPAGFPNGRRPGDDVVDIELRVAMGYLLPPDPTTNPSGQVPLTDGTASDATEYKAVFPYINTPLPGSPNPIPAGQDAPGGPVN